MTIAVIAALNLSSTDCPLTVLEMRLIRASGHVPYDTGFISHYFVEPFHPQASTGASTW
jgi:hypothetical protein